MAKYKIKGQRILRKYTEDRTSPVYAASVEVQKIVDSLCTVPWTKVSSDSATMTYHTEENVGTEEDPVSGLDMNVRIRDQFDAALFCAGHSGGQHRAYANAAVYRFTIPDEAVGLTLTSLGVRVTSDPYNSTGVRIHAATNSTGEIPTNCHECRGEDQDGEVVDDGTTAAEVAVRTVRTIDGDDYWYPTTETCTLMPTGGLTLQKYLLVFVLLENYNVVRGNWIEGSAFIENLVTVNLSGEVGSLDPDAVNDLTGRSSGTGYPVISDGILPDHTEDEVLPARSLDVKIKDGISGLYRRFLTGSDEVKKSPPNARRRGARFSVRFENTVDGAVEVRRIRMESSVLVVPFTRPSATVPTRMFLSFTSRSMSDGALFRVYVSEEYLGSLSEDKLKDPNLYDGMNSVGGLRFLGEIGSGVTSATFDLPLSSSRFGSVVIAGYMPPECVDTDSTDEQGTGPEFIPNISIA